MAIFKEFPVIETERLILRKMTVADAPALFEILSDDKVTENMDIYSHHDVSETIAVINEMNDLYEKDYLFRFGIVRKEDNQLIGTCGYNSWIMFRGARGEIGYEIGTKYWRNGYMNEALTALLDFGFTKGLNRVEAMVLPTAADSMKVLARLGFKCEGILREHGYWKDQFWDEYCFSLLKREWEK